MKPVTRVLFTSESFGRAVRDDVTEPGGVSEADDTSSHRRCAEHLLAKVRVGARSRRPLREQWKETFGTRVVDASAPRYGRTLVGSVVLQRHYEPMQRVLGELGGTR